MLLLLLLLRGDCDRTGNISKILKTKGFGESKLKKRCVISVLAPVDDDDDDDDQAPSCEGVSRP